MAAAKKTPLHDAHVALGARMVDFGGWRMPLQYPTGIVKEHRAVRAAAGVFDVSHMGEIAVRGPGAEAAVQRLITNDAGALDDGAALYTVMCREDGGTLDDLIVYRRAPGDYLLVVNAANIEKDLAWVREVAGGGAEVVDESDATGLLAVQGPKAAALCARLADADLEGLARFRAVRCQIAGVPVMAARTGYTGEDGFELACPADRAAELFERLLEDGGPERPFPVGLGARDTLRLEARLLLYGNDLDETTTPYEAGLGWVVKLEAKDFVGKEALVAQRQAGVGRRLVGFAIEGRGIARRGHEILDRGLAGDPVIGKVTSGAPGISVPGAIGLGYVPSDRAAPGTELTIDIRGKDATARVIKGPFYKRGPA